MAREAKPWHLEAARLLASGLSVSETAAAVGVSRETVSRGLSRPGSLLPEVLAAEKAKLANPEETQRTQAMLDHALRVLGEGLSSADLKTRLDCAKTILARLEPPPAQVVRVEDGRAGEGGATASAAEQLRALGEALPSVAVLLRESVPGEVRALLREGLAAAQAALDAAEGKAAAPADPAPTAGVLPVVPSVH